MTIFWPRSSKPSVQLFFLYPFHRKPRLSPVTLESPELENIPQVLGNRLKVGQNHAARKAVWATFSFKWSGAIFRPRSSKACVQLFFLGPFHWKARLSRVSLESPGLENIPQVLGNRPKVGQNNAARKAVWATFSLSNEVGLYFGLEVKQRALNYFSSVHFTENQSYHESV